MRFIDLFAGAGGMRLGLDEVGFECVYTSENDKHAQMIYKENFGGEIAGDITKIDEKEVPDHDLLVAGFPCQPFSISGRKLGFLDTRGTLFFDIMRIIKGKKPKTVLLENVKNLKNHDKGRTLEVIIKSLEEEGYKVTYEIMNASNFGVPQNRERTIIIANKEKKFNFKNIEKKKKVTLKEIINEKEKHEYIEKSKYTLIEEKYIKEQKSGLIFVGYMNKNIRKKGVRENTEHLSRVHKQPNRIYSSEGVHPTLNAQETAGRNYIYHNGKVRKLTLEECYLIMGFPKDYKKLGSKAECYKRIGNSVCVPMIKEIGIQMKKQLIGGVKNEKK